MVGEMARRLRKGHCQGGAALHAVAHKADALGSGAAVLMPPCPLLAAPTAPRSRPWPGGGLSRAGRHACGLYACGRRSSLSLSLSLSRYLHMCLSHLSHLSLRSTHVTAPPLISPTSRPAADPPGHVAAHQGRRHERPEGGAVPLDQAGAVGPAQGGPGLPAGVLFSCCIRFPCGGNRRSLDSSHKKTAGPRQEGWIPAEQDQVHAGWAQG